jgi:hypothetical protein
MNDLIADVLGGEEFSAQVLGRAHGVYPADDGNRDRFGPLLTWSALNEILSSHRLGAPRLRLVRAGETLPESSYCRPRTSRYGPSWQAPVPHLVHARLRDGATLVLSEIDEIHPPVREVAAALERRLRTRVRANLYASWTAQQGFGVHWDDHDVIVVQVSGAKQWRVYGATRPSPLHRDVAHDDEAPRHPIDDLTLRAGDALHVPRGWWHAAATAAGQPSVHLTFGLDPHTGADLLTWLIDELRTQEALRTDIPLGVDDRTAWRGEVAKVLAERLGDEDLIPTYLAARDATYEARGSFGLPHGVAGELPADPDLPVRLTAPRAVSHGTGQTVTLEAAGQRWVLAAKAAPMIQLLVSGERVTLGALAGASGITVQQAVGVLGQLLTAGVLAVAG